MDKKYRQINVLTFVGIALIMGTLVITAFQSGHPWSLTCYQCRACNLKCPLGYDVARFVSAAYSNDPDLYMDAQNLQLRLDAAYETDPNMVVEIEGNTMTAEEAHKKYPGNMIVYVRKLRVKDAAKFDPLDGACETTCPIDLPITNIIRDLKEDGVFG